MGIPMKFMAERIGGGFMEPLATDQQATVIIFRRWIVFGNRTARSAHGAHGQIADRNGRCGQHGATAR